MTELLSVQAVEKKSARKVETVLLRSIQVPWLNLYYLYLLLVWYHHYCCHLASKISMKVSKIDVALQKALQQARAQKQNKARSIPQKESNIKKVAPGQARTFTLAEKKKICDHTTIADDISGEIGRNLDEGRKLVAKHFNITMEQLTRISVEGLKKLWSIPPESARNKPEYRYLYGKGKKTLIHKNLDRYSCYELGYRFGKCAAKSMKGIICDPENDFVMPPRCRNKPEIDEGMTAGLKSVD